MLIQTFIHIHNNSVDCGDNAFVLHICAEIGFTSTIVYLSLKYTHDVAKNVTGCSLISKHICFLSEGKSCYSQKTVTI